MRISTVIDNAERPAEVFGSISNPLRLQIVRTLMHHPMCVSRLTVALEAPQSSVSRALSILRKAGLVLRNRCGAFTRYELAETLDGELLAPLYGLISDLIPDIYDEAATDEALVKLGIKTPPLN